MRLKISLMKRGRMKGSGENENSLMHSLRNG